MICSISFKIESDNTDPSSRLVLAQCIANSSSTTWTSFLPLSSDHVLMDLIASPAKRFKESAMLNGEIPSNGRQKFHYFEGSISSPAFLDGKDALILLGN